MGCHQGSLGTVLGCWRVSGPLGTDSEQPVLSANWWQLLRAKAAGERPPLLNQHPVLPVGLRLKVWVLGALAEKSYRKKHLEVGVARRALPLSCWVAEAQGVGGSTTEGVSAGLKNPAASMH